MMTAIVPEYVGWTMSPSPAMTRVRSVDAAPQRLIQRRTGNQYTTAIVTAMTSVAVICSLRNSGRHRSTENGETSVIPISRSCRSHDHAAIGAAAPDQHHADRQEPDHWRKVRHDRWSPAAGVVEPGVIDRTAVHRGDRGGA